MGRKRKVGTAGRFGSRYGKKARSIVATIEKVERQRHICPKCDLPYVRRLGKGMWICKKCGNKFAGLAYYPKTEGE